MSVTGSASENARKARGGRIALGCFFSVFLVIGGIASVFVFFVPLAQTIAARSWRPTPCTILTSEVATHPSSKGGPTYSVAVTYEYFVDDQRYVSSRYRFTTGSSSGYAGKKEVVDRLGPGTPSTCYVDKRNPSEAVLMRDFSLEMLFGLIPLIFVAVGGGGIYGVFVYKGKKRDPAAVPGLPVAAPPSKSGGAALKSSASPAGRLGCSLGFALVWNGIVSIFAANIFSGWAGGKGDGCSTLFLIPFLLVGLGVIVLAFYYFLALFNPRPSLRVSGGGAAALGETVEIEWETSGNVDRVKVFTITLEGREEATYKRGTSQSTDKSVFASMEIVNSPKGREMRRGKAKLAIPADTMHSFKSAHNRIVWCFKLKGDIPRWPDVNEEYPFEILPQRLPPGGAS